MTSTAEGTGGLSFGWINHDLIAAGHSPPGLNLLGGEDRLWLGPQGSQFSVFFPAGAPFDAANRTTPPALDTEAWTTTERSGDRIVCRREMRLVNRAGTEFVVEASREIQALAPEEVLAAHGIAWNGGDIQAVAYASRNTIRNVGARGWTREHGLLSIWAVGMFPASADAVAVIPFQADIGKAASTPAYRSYYGDIPSDRLAVRSNVVVLRADAEHREKIGVPPRRAKAVLGSYDRRRGCLTLIWYSGPQRDADYVNSQWGDAVPPFAGDAVNAYNDGPVGPAGQRLGSYYELETSSPGLALKPGERAVHLQVIVHVHGGVAELDRVAKAALGVGLGEMASRPVAQRVYWGDTHLHTNNSLDAGLFGCILGPEEAFRFARGDVVKSSTGSAARLGRPYDFLVVTDHSDYMGLLRQLNEGSPALLADAVGRRWYQAYHALRPKGTEPKALIAEAVVRALSTGVQVLKDPGVAETAWALAVAAAEKFNQPGRFTAFIGYEWSSTPGGDNLHRNVIFRDGADRAMQVLPLTAFESENPERLWQWMTDYEHATGGRVLAIPHNSNLSGGRMFAATTFAGGPFTWAYAATRSAHEPVVEIVQSKGDSETDPVVSPNDDFAAFERWDRNNLFNSRPATPEQQQFNYVRPALTRGLRLAQELGANPFQFGFVGGTDSHNGLSTVEPDNYFGNRPATEPGASRLARAVSAKERWTGDLVSAGLTAVWARENSRAALFDAIERREVYATTGPRLTVRIFGGWDFTADDLHRVDLPEYGYTHGVPMGGELRKPLPGKRMNLVIQATKDPQGANLDRVQVVKGWVDDRGLTHEAIFDAAWSGDRKPDKDGKVPAIASTVDTHQATYRNDVGAPTLTTVWTDPAFNPRERSHYYVRVLEILTPRWTTYDAARYGLPLPPQVPPEEAQRAYTSPIWYSPDSAP
jgi:hypothetical protein